MIQFLRRGTQIVSGRDGRLSSEFERWLLELYQNLGFDHRRPVYREIPLVPIKTITLANVVGDLNLPTFPDAASTNLRFIGTLPNDYRDGTDLIPYVAWLPSNTDTGLCRWHIAHGIIGTGEALTSTSANNDDAGSGTADAQQVKQCSALAGSGFRKGDSIAVTLERLGSDAADTFTGAARLIGFGLRYKADGVGTVAAFP